LDRGGLGRTREEAQGEVAVQWNSGGGEGAEAWCLEMECRAWGGVIRKKEKTGFLQTPGGERGSVPGGMGASLGVFAERRVNALGKMWKKGARKTKVAGVLRGGKRGGGGGVCPKESALGARGRETWQKGGGGSNGGCAGNRCWR